MTIEEMERAFAERLPVVARVNSVGIDETFLNFSCIHCIKRRWDSNLGREVQELELLDKSRRGITVVPIGDVFLSNDDSFTENDFFKCQRAYERYFGMMTPGVCDSIEFYLREGMEAELIVRIMEYAYEQGKRNWSYLSSILKNKLKDNIKTLDEYKRAEAEWASKTKRSGQAGIRKRNFNYNDTNKPDYSNYADKILKEMLGN